MGPGPTQVANQFEATPDSREEPDDLPTTADESADDLIGGNDAEKFVDDEGQALGSPDDSAFKASTTSLEAQEVQPSPVALVLRGSRRQFLQALDSPELPRELRRALQRATDPTMSEAATAHAVAAAGMDAADGPAAAAICAAFAARTVARAMQHAWGSLKVSDADTILAAWRDAAHSIVVGRGGEGLLLLSPIAALLAKRAIEHGETVVRIADVTRRMGDRIAADTKLGKGLARVSSEEYWSRGIQGPPRRIVLHGPVEIAINPS